MSADLGKAYSDGLRDGREGMAADPWPWDDGGPDEQAYHDGYRTGRMLRQMAA
jgi:hypothetical protein